MAILRVKSNFVTAIETPDTMMDEEKQLETPQGKTAETPAPEGTHQAKVEPETSEFAAETTILSDAAVEPLDGTVEGSADGSGDDFAPTVAGLQQEIATLTQALQTTQSQFEDIQGQYTRLAADFDNFRKRTQKEKEELSEQVKCSTIKELLPIVDNFERARSQLKPQSDGEMNIHKSYQSVYKQMVDCLKRIGVAPMRPEGEQFDPNLHDAVMREETDEYAEGTVIEELMRGYTMGDRVLRHAMVKVATESTSASGSTHGEADA
ncbi:MAG: nucleotide exchange factor GrpE [Geitlerinemataceae cyanobacterium]